MSATTTTERLTAVDSLRGIAILMVIFAHTAGWIVPTAPWLKQVAEIGPRGVQLFYVVSAFSLFLSYAQRKADGDFSYGAYFIRRIARIAPMFWIAVVLNVAIYGLAPRYWAPNGLSWSDVALTVFFANGFKPDAITSVVPGGWSVAVETSFYLLLPIFFVTVRSMRGALVAAAICLIAGTFACEWYVATFQTDYPEATRWLPYAFAWSLWLPSQLPVFALGIVLFYIRDNMPRTRSLSVFWLALAVYLLAAAMRAPADGFARIHVTASVGLVFLSLAVMNGDLRVLDNRVLQLVGKVSFSIYLLHMTILSVAHKLAERAGITETGNLRFFAAFCIIVPVCVAVSYCAYRLVELPGMRLGSKLARALERPAVVLAGR